MGSPTFIDHVNDYRIIVESKKLIKMFMAEEHDQS
jgi:hypothetical protein